MSLAREMRYAAKGLRLLGMVTPARILEQYADRVERLEQVCQCMIDQREEKK